MASTPNNPGEPTSGAQDAAPDQPPVPPSHVSRYIERDYSNEEALLGELVTDLALITDTLGEVVEDIGKFTKPQYRGHVLVVMRPRLAKAHDVLMDIVVRCRALPEFVALDEAAKATEQPK